MQEKRWGRTSRSVLFSIPIACVLTFSSPTPIWAQEGVGHWLPQRFVVSTADELNLRAGPGQNYPVLGQVNRGDMLEFLERRGDWYRARRADGQEVWLAAWYATLQERNATVRVRADVLNVRLGPGLSHAIVGRLQMGETVQVLSGRDGWLHVSGAGVTGWVDARYVEDASSPTSVLSAGNGSGVSPMVPTSPAVPVAPPTPVPARDSSLSPEENAMLDRMNRAVPAQVARVVNGPARFRQGPSLNYSTLGELAVGAELPVIGGQNGWLRLRNGNEAGWVSGTLLELRDQVASGARYRLAEGSWQMSAAGTLGETSVRASRLNVRSLPKETARVLGQLNQGERVEILEETDGWVRVTADRLTGWVAADYLQRGQASSATGLHRVDIRETSEGVIQVRLEGQLKGLRFVPSERLGGLLMTWDVQPGWNGYVPIGVPTLQSAHVLEQGVWLQVGRTPGWRVLQQSEQVVEIELRPVLRAIAWDEPATVSAMQEQVAAAGSRRRLLLKIDGPLPARWETQGDRVVVKLAGGLQQEGLQVPEGVQLQAAGSQLEIRLPRWGQPILKSDPEGLAMEFLSPGLAGKRIAIDPGHGGSESGAVGVSGQLEKNYNLQVALTLKDALMAAGAEVFLTREHDRRVADPARLSALPTERERLTLDLSTRAELASQWGADILLSIHHNSGPSHASGVETYWANAGLNPSQRLAQSLHQEIVRTTGRLDRGVHHEVFLVLLQSEIPAALLELGFVSNRAEEGALASTQGQERAVAGILRGLERYFAGQ